MTQEWHSTVSVWTCVCVHGFYCYRDKEPPEEKKNLIWTSYRDWLNDWPCYYKFNCLQNLILILFPVITPNSVSLDGFGRNVAMVTELLICLFSPPVPKTNECTEAVHYGDKMNACYCVRFIESDNGIIKGCGLMRQKERDWMWQLCLHYSIQCVLSWVVWFCLHAPICVLSHVVW